MTENDLPSKILEMCAALPPETRSKFIKRLEQALPAIKRRALFKVVAGGKKDNSKRD